MWGYLSTVLGVFVAFNCIALAIRFVLRAPSDVAIALALSTILYVGAILLILSPPTPEASAESIAYHKQVDAPVATPAPASANPIAAASQPPAASIAESSPPEVILKVVPEKPTPEPAKLAPPVDARWQYQRYRIGEPPEAKPSDKPQDTVIIEQPERRSQYSRYAVPADRLTTQPGKPKALFVIHAGTDGWSPPFYPSQYRYRFEATGAIQVQINGRQIVSDLATVNQSGSDVQSLSFKASGTEPVTIYVYPAQP